MNCHNDTFWVQYVVKLVAVRKSVEYQLADIFALNTPLIIVLFSWDNFTKMKNFKNHLVREKLMNVCQKVLWFSLKKFTCRRKKFFGWTSDYNSFFFFHLALNSHYKIADRSPQKFRISKIVYKQRGFRILFHKNYIKSIAIIACQNYILFILMYFSLKLFFCFNIFCKGSLFLNAIITYLFVYFVIKIFVRLYYVFKFYLKWTLIEV